jgi:hypothetical protein
MLMADEPIYGTMRLEDKSSWPEVEELMLSVVKLRIFVDELPASAVQAVFQEIVPVQVEKHAPTRQFRQEAAAGNRFGGIASFAVKPAAKQNTAHPVDFSRLQPAEIRHLLSQWSVRNLGEREQLDEVGPRLCASPADRRERLGKPV